MAVNLRALSGVRTRIERLNCETGLAPLGIGLSSLTSSTDCTVTMYVVSLEVEREQEISPLTLPTILAQQRGARNWLLAAPHDSSLVGRNPYPPLVTDASTGN